jgi:hypothetical protein
MEFGLVLNWSNKLQNFEQATNNLNSNKNVKIVSLLSQDNNH